MKSLHIFANFQISERGTNERKKFKKRNIPKFPIHYYTKIAAKTGTHDKIILFFASKRGTVPPKEEQLASMLTPAFCDGCQDFNYSGCDKSPVQLSKAIENSLDLGNKKFEVLCPNLQLKSKQETEHELKYVIIFDTFNRCVWHFIAKEVEGDSF